MTGKERIKAAIEHRVSDVVPYDAYASPGHVMHLLGRQTHEIYTVKGILPKAMINANKLYHSDAIYARGDLYIGDEWEFISADRLFLKDKYSGKVTHALTFDDFAVVSTVDLDYTLMDYRRIPKIKNREDLTKLKITPKEKLLKLCYFDSIRTYVDQLGGDTFIFSGSAGPSMNSIAICRGLEQGLIDLYEDTYICQAIMEWRAEQIEEEVLAFKQLGAEGIVTGDAYATCSLVPPEKYRKILFPYQKRAVEFIKKQGLACILHVCGRTSAILEDLAATGTDILEAVEARSTGGDNDLADAKRRVGHLTCLKGNIDAKNVIQQGPPQMIEQACFEAMEAAAAGGGFILSTEQVTPDTSFENNYAMHQARLKYKVS